MLTLKSLNLLINLAAVGAFTATQLPAMAQSAVDYWGQSNQSSGNADWDRSQTNRTWEDYAPPTADTESGHYQNY